MELTSELIQEFVGNTHGNFAKVKELLEAHPDLLNASAPWNETAVQAATQMGNLAILNYLIEHGAPVDLFTAAVLGRRDQVRAFVEADPGLVKTVGVHGFPLLYFPVIRGEAEIAGYLLERGAEVNAGAGGTTALHGAVMFNQLERDRWLLEHGAGPNLLNYENKTPLKLAVEGKKDEIAALLLEKGGTE